MNKVVLLILDGWGYTEETKGNAIKAAYTPCFNELWKSCPHTLLHASGTHVGLPEGIMGNSEVGHENIGAGRVVKQKLTMISDLIKTREFFANPNLNKAMNHSQRLHLMGLISEGDVHSHLGHLDALIEMAQEKGIAKENIFLHAITDGRDDPPYVASKLMKRYQDKIPIATVSGRYWAMDRDKNWDRNKKYFECVIKKLNHDSNCEHARSAVEAIDHGYALAKNGKNPAGDSDEFILPTLIDHDGLIDDNDSLIFFNYRPDRARQISMFFEYFSSDDKVRKDQLASNSLFEGFSDKVCAKLPGFHLNNFKFTCFTEYSSVLNLPIAFTDADLPEQDFKDVLGEVISKHGLNQLRTAETEKFNHVTSFFNVRSKDPFKNEDRKLIPSPKVATYDLQPEMSLPELTKLLCDSINDKSKNYSLIVCNFANPDMVGHTGKWDAIIKALEEVDRSLFKVLEACSQAGYALMLTADHGNADQVTELNGDIRTAHSTNKVPFILVNSEAKLLKQSQDLALANIAPTVLEVMGIEKPASMTAESLITK